MRRFHRIGILALCLCLLTLSLTACRAKEEEAVETLHIYASFYPIYAIAQEITKDVPDLTLHQLVQPQDGCLRSYQLSDWDAALLASADGLLLCGGGLESFADALSSGAGEQMAVVQLTNPEDRLTVVAENADFDRTSHWQGENPHIYMSPSGAMDLAAAIANGMAVLDPRYEELYLDHLTAVNGQLEELQQKIAEETAVLHGVKTAVLHEALAYAARDYGLDAIYWARESGESADAEGTEALLSALREEEVQLVLLERQAPQGLREALENAGFAVAALDVLSTHRADEGSRAYFDALYNNAAAARTSYESIFGEKP